MRYYKIKGVLSVPDDVDISIINHAIIDGLSVHNSSFGGRIRELPVSSTINTYTPIQPIKTIVQIWFHGIDDYNRPVFKDVNSKAYYGSVDSLYARTVNSKKIKEITAYFKSHLGELQYFGTSFNCEPHGGLRGDIQLEIID